MKKAPKPFMGQYENMDFPEYKFQEFPKMVLLKEPLPDGTTSIIVNSHAEELRAVEEIVQVKTFDNVVAQRDNLQKLLEETQKQLAALKPVEGDLTSLEDEVTKPVKRPVTIPVPTGK